MAPTCPSLSPWPSPLPNRLDGDPSTIHLSCTHLDCQTISAASYHHQLLQLSHHCTPTVWVSLSLLLCHHKTIVICLLPLMADDHLPLHLIVSSRPTCFHCSSQTQRAASTILSSCYPFSLINSTTPYKRWVHSQLLHPSLKDMKLGSTFNMFL